MLDRRTRGRRAGHRANNVIVTRDVTHARPGHRGAHRRATRRSPPRSPTASSASITRRHPARPTRRLAARTRLGNLIADAQLAATDGATGRRRRRVHEPGRRARRPRLRRAGERRLTYGEAFAVQPFGNTLVTHDAHRRRSCSRCSSSSGAGRRAAAADARCPRATRALHVRPPSLPPIALPAVRAALRTRSADVTIGGAAGRPGASLPDHRELVPRRRRRPLHHHCATAPTASAALVDTRRARAVLAAVADGRRRSPRPRSTASTSSRRRRSPCYAVVAGHCAPAAACGIIRSA